MFHLFMKNLESLLQTYEIEVVKNNQSWKVRCNLKEKPQEEEEVQINLEVPRELQNLVKQASKIKKDLKKNKITVNEFHLARKLQVELPEAKKILGYLVN